MGKTWSLKVKKTGTQLRTHRDSPTFLLRHRLRGWHRSGPQLSQSPTAVARDNMDLRLKTLVTLAVVLSCCSDEAFSQGRRRGSGRGGGASECHTRIARLQCTEMG